MNRKLVWFSILSIFILAWGASGYSVGRSHRKLLTQSVMAHAGSPAASETAEPVGIPVTGRSQPGWGILILYGLIVLAALTLILALLDSANQSTAWSSQRRVASQEGRKR